MRAITVLVGVLFAVVGLAVFLWVSAPVEETPLFEVAEGHAPPAYLAGTISSLLESTTTGRTYQISVAVPRGYETSGLTYPVLYAVDANGEFGTVVESARLMSFDEDVPELIVVGIGYPVGYFFDAISPRSVDLTPTEDAEWKEQRAREVSDWPIPEGSGGAPEFLRFLSEELIPLIETEYRVVGDDRGLYGHSLGGLFAFHALLHGEGTFQRFIVGSPSLWWHNRVIFEHEAAFSKGNDSLSARVFFAVGALEDSEEDADEVGGRMASDLRELVEVVAGREYAGLEFSSHIFENETHTSVIPATISRGLRYIYGEQ
jgi:hypothetical protein